MQPLIEYLQQIARFQRNARLFLLSNVLSGVSTGILVVLYNLYLSSLGYGADFVGLALFMATIGGGLAIFPAGLLVDRVSGKAIMIWSTLIIGAIGAGQILFRQPIPLLATALLAGVAGAALLAVTVPFLATNSTAEERPNLFSLNIVLGLATTVVGELIGGALPGWFRLFPALMVPLPSPFNWLLATQIEPRSYQLALLTAGLIALPGFIPLFLMKDTGPRVRPDSGNIQEVSSLWSMLRSFRLASQLDLLKKLIRVPFFTILVMQVLVGLGAGLFISYFNLYFVKHLGASPALFGFIDGGANIMNALFTLLAPPIARRMGRVRTIVTTRLISLPLLLTVGLTPVLSVAATFYLFRQGFMDMSVGILQVFSMEIVPEEHRGLANSGYQASFQVAWALTAPLGGVIIVHLGYSPVFITGAIFYLFSIMVLWSRFGNTDKENLASARDATTFHYER